MNNTESKKTLRSTLKHPASILSAIIIIIVAGVLIWGWSIMLKMPGKSYQGTLPPLSEDESALSYLLQEDVIKIAEDIGERNLKQYQNLSDTADFIELSFSGSGYKVKRYDYEVGGKTCSNLEVEITGSEKPEKIVVIGAHYDTVPGSPGANDNGSGVAALIALSGAFKEKQPARTLRFVAFVNEEPPYFHSPLMGSLKYAIRCQQRDDDITAMLSLETIGYYTDEKGSQDYPFPLNLFYPSAGNFIAFVGNTASGSLVREVVESFRNQVQFPSEGGAFPGYVPGIGWSDHWSFWQQGYPAIMITDTAVFRYPYYHQPEDTPEKIDFDRMARVVKGLEKVIDDLTTVH